MQIYYLYTCIHKKRFVSFICVYFVILSDGINFNNLNCCVLYMCFMQKFSNTCWICFGPVIINVGL